MAKRQLLLSSPEKKRLKDPDDEKLRNMVADELKLQLGVVREIFREEIQPMAERIGSLEKELRAISNNFDNIQSVVRKLKQDSVEVKQAVVTLQDKMARLEDKSRQSNLRLVGLKEGEEGSNPVVYLQAQLPKWIPALRNGRFEIERAHRIYTSDSKRKGLQTLVFELLRFQDRNAILTGARAAGQILHKGNLLHFYPDYSNQTATQRREMNLCRKKLTQIGISSFLIYPSIVKVTHHGSTALLQTPLEVEMYLAQQQALATPTSARNNTPAKALMEASP
ncbi:uncharacterized protein LOC122133667 [Tachysurus ichikawai]